jgi:hypothetical protein
MTGTCWLMVEKDAAYAQAKLDALSGSDVVRVRKEPSARAG